jgi:recombinational DNA repair protein (RecF pathway)
MLTRSFGVINAKVQGARSLRSKLRSGSQDLSCGEFSLVCGKSGWKVVSVRPEKNLFESLRSYPDRLKIAVNVLGLVKKLVGEDESHSGLYDIADNFLVFIEKAKLEEMPLAECLTLARILHSLGYMHSDPELSLPISSHDIEPKDLEAIAPRRSRLVRLINESLKSA